MRSVHLVALSVALAVSQAAFAGPGPTGGDSTIGAYDAAAGRFFLRNSNSGGAADGGSFLFQQPNRIPITGDWDGS